LILALIPLIRLVEVVHERCTHSHDLTVSRHAFVARMFCKLLFFGLDQMAVPLALFWIENMRNAEIPSSTVSALLWWAFLVIQLLGVYLFNWSSVRFAGYAVKSFGRKELPNNTSAEKWQYPLENAESSALAGIEIYRFGCRYWIFVEMAYDLLNGLLVAWGASTPKAYWINIALHMLYTYLHATLQPSFYKFHNRLQICVGCCELFEDIAVLQSIYGDGTWGSSPAWVSVSLFFPFGAAIAELVVEHCFQETPESCSDDEDSKRERESAERRSKHFGRALENGALLRAYRFLTCVLLVAVVIIHLATFAGIPPGGSTIATGVMVSIYMVAICGIMVYFLFVPQCQMDTSRVKGFEERGDEIPLSNACCCCLCHDSRVHNSP
jgi:hypothetical protein